MHGLCEYERRRVARMAENMAELTRLGLIQSFGAAKTSRCGKRASPGAGTTDVFRARKVTRVRVMYDTESDFESDSDPVPLPHDFSQSVPLPAERDGGATSESVGGQVADDDVEFVRCRTLEERNAEGFRNATVLD